MAETDTLSVNDRIIFSNSLEDAHSQQASRETAPTVIPSNGLSATAWKDSISSKDKDVDTKTGAAAGALFSFQHSHQLSGSALLPDSLDEAEKEEEDSSSLGYSDDSASLSDAYFHPQPGDNLRGPYGRLIYGNGPVNPYQAHQLDPVVNTYGSLQNGTHHNQGLPPFWIGGPIQEDMETMLPFHLPGGSAQSSSMMMKSHHTNRHNVVIDVSGAESTALLSSTPSYRQQQHGPKRERRRSSHSSSTSRHHRQLQKLHIKQREHAAAREKAVSQIRGQPQALTSWQDPFWAFVFIAQLVLVGACALRFGFGVILFKDHPVWGEVPPPYNNGAMLNETSFNNTRFMSSGPEVNASLNILNVSESETSSSVTGDASILESLSNPSNAFLESDLNHFGGDEIDMEFFTIDYKNVLAITFFAGFYACILSYISFGFMLILARSLILIMLIFSILVALAWGIIGLTLDPYGVISVMGFAALLSTLGYTMYSWHRIPFAATNLYTALTAMRCTADITILGLLSLVVAFGWCLLWSMAFIGIVNALNDDDCSNKDVCRAHVNRRHIPLLLLLLLSFHWTTMVMKNIVRVTVASAIGTWWFHPSEIGPICTSAVILPLWRSLTVSLGSICLGSLVVSPAQCVLSLGRLCCGCFDTETLQETSSSSSENHKKMNCMGGYDGTCSSNSSGKPSRGFFSLLNIGDTEDGSVSGGVIADIQTTVDSPADNFAVSRRFCALIEPCYRWLRSCNRWAFTYIGMYSYSFVTAGDKALQLFETRGWIEVVEDSLIQNVLLMASVVIGGSTGVFAVVVEETDGFYFTSFHQPIITAFVIGSVLGYVLSNILLLGVVGSAVSTVLVCFAAGPFDFDQNHPRLSREMRDVWSQQVWEQASTAPAATQIMVHTFPSTRHHYHHSSITSATIIT